MNVTNLNSHPTQNSLGVWWVAFFVANIVLVGTSIISADIIIDLIRSVYAMAFYGTNYSEVHDKIQQVTLIIILITFIGGLISSAKSVVVKWWWTTAFVTYLCILVYYNIFFSPNADTTDLIGSAILLFPGVVIPFTFAAISAVITSIYKRYPKQTQ
jgi:hypothetical protein